jgi:hypothetical protein
VGNEEELLGLKADLAAGKSVPALVDALKAKGYPEAAINELIQKAFQTQTVEKDAKGANGSNVKRRIDPAKAFVWLGIILILSAVIAAIAANWSGATPWLKVLYTAVPMIIFYVLSFFLARNEETKIYERLTFVTASLLLPVSVGTTLYEFGVYKDLNSHFVAICTGLAAAYFLFFEFYAKRSYLSLLSILSLYVTFEAILFNWSLNNEFASGWCTIGFSLLILVVGVLLKNKDRSKDTYLATGTVLSLVGLPIMIYQTIDKYTDSLPFESPFFFVAAVGLLYLMVAHIYNSYSEKLGGDELIYNLKRLVEEVAVPLVVLPIVFLGTSDSLRHYYLFISLFLGIGAILAAARLKIKSLPLSGGFMILISVLTLASDFFHDSAKWPLLVIIFGFLSIALGLWIRRIYKDQESLDLFWGLGQDVERENKIAHKATWWSVLLTIIVVWFIIGTAASFIMGAGMR